MLRVCHFFRVGAPESGSSGGSNDAYVSSSTKDLQQRYRRMLKTRLTSKEDIAKLASSRKTSDMNRKLMEKQHPRQILRV
jgi:hypothetical protein